MGHKVKQSLMSSRIDFFYYAFRNVLLVSVPLLVVCSIVLSHLSFHSSATDSSSGSTSSTDSLSFSISSSCTLSSVVDSSHTAELINGTYTNGIGKTTITTLCNDGNGYSVYAVGYSNNEEGNNKLINSERPEYSIDTGLNTSGLTSQWAMKLNNIPDDPSPTPPTIESDYNNTYGIVPSYWIKVASRASGTTDMAQGSSFTTTYAVYTSSSQFTGTYQGQVKYVLVHPYRNDSTITTVPTFEESFALGGKEKVTINGTDFYKMQDMGSLICERISNTNETPTTQLADIRDNKLYWVAKLADGKCWMTQNLDLDIGGTNTMALTSENTDISTNASGSGIYANGYTENNGVWTWNPASTAITSSSIVNYGNNTVSNWSNNNSTPTSAEGGDTYFYTSGNDNNDKRYDSLELCEKDHTETDCLHYHAGNYYSWTAAIASNTSSSISANTAIAGNSICPRGWRLPYTSTTDNSYNEFGRLFYGYNITNNLANSTGSVGYKSGGFNALRTSPLWFVRSGYIYNGTLAEPAAGGNYWSSTVTNSTDAYNLLFYSNSINLAGSYSRGGGRSVRCIAR